MIERFQKLIGFWYNLHPMVRLIVGIAVLCLLGWKVGYPGYQYATKSWRGWQLVQAERAILEGNMEKAKNLSSSVLNARDSRQIEALRILEKSMTALQDPNRSLVGRYLVFHPNGSAEDRYRGFLLMLEDSPLGLVGMGWASLPKEAHQDRRIALPFCDRLMRHNKLQETINVVSGFEGWQTDWELLRPVIRAHIANDTSDSYTKAQEMIDLHWPVGDQDSGLALLEAIPILKLNVGLLQKSLTRLNPEIPREAMLRARFEYSQQQWSRLEIVESVMRQWKDLASLDVAKFLLAAGMHYKLLSLYPPSSNASKTDSMILLLLEACAKEKEWAKALEYLNAQTGQLDIISLLGWKSVVFEKLKMNDDLDIVNIEITKEITTKAAAKLYLKLVEIMQLADIPEREHQYLLEAIRLRNAPLPLFSDISPLLDYLYSKGSEASISEVIVSYLSFEPNNPLILAHFTYHSCMTKNCDPAVLNDTIQKLLEIYDQSPHLRAVSAAIQLSRGEFEEAKKIANQVSGDLSQLPPGYEAAITIGRYKTGTVTMDNEEINKLRWTKMLPIEYDFYKSFLDRDSSEKKEFNK